jgi:hypothetical protein
MIGESSTILVHNPPQDKGSRQRKTLLHKYRIVKGTYIDKEHRIMAQSYTQWDLVRLVKILQGDPRFRAGS